MIECYETISYFPNFPPYKKKKKYEKFRGSFEHEAPLNPPLPIYNFRGKFLMDKESIEWNEKKLCNIFFFFNQVFLSWWQNL